MSLRSRRAGGGGRGRPQLGVALGLAAVVVAVLAILGLGLWQRQTAVRTDPDTLCPEAGPSAVTVILVDATDGMSDVQKAAVRTRLEQVVARLEEYEQVQVYSLDASAELLKPGFRVCRPKSPDDTSDWTENRTLAKRRFDEVFRPRLDTVLASAVERPGSPTSPIMEGIQKVVVGALQKADVAAAGPLPKRLVIVSDMLENGAGGSHYRATPDFATFRESPAYRRLRADMEGIEVRILYLGRAEADDVQGTAHAEFWREYFADQDADVERIIWIEG